LANGDVLALIKDSARIADHIDSAADVYIDGRDAGDTVGNPEIRERRLLSEEGVVTAIAVVDLKDYQIVAGPDIVSRGFVYMHESQELIKAANHEVFWAILNTFKNHKHVDRRALNRTIISRLQKLLYARTGRRPVIIPMVTILNGDRHYENHHYRQPNNNKKKANHEKNNSNNRKNHQQRKHNGHKKQTVKKEPVAAGKNE